MRWMTTLFIGLAMTLGGLAMQTALAQESGETLLDEAVQKKLDAKTPRDMDKVADLCEEAIEQGLEEESLATARKLWASACFEHAELLAKRVFSPTPDTRWKFLRQQALERLEKTVELTPDNSNAWLLIAEFNLLEGGDEEAASQAVAKALENSSDDPGQQARTLILRSRTTDDNEKKWADINQALEVEPENRLGLRIRGQMYVADEKFDEAVADFAKLAELQENNPVELLLLARALRTSDKNEAALKAVSRAIEINQDLPMAYSLRGAVHGDGKR